LRAIKSFIKPGKIEYELDLEFAMIVVTHVCIKLLEGVQGEA
jgi:hypothetical protein